MQPITYISIEESQFKKLMQRLDDLEQYVGEIAGAAKSEWIPKERFIVNLGCGKTFYHELKNGKVQEGFTLRTRKIGSKEYVHRNELMRVFEHEIETLIE